MKRLVTCYLCEVTFLCEESEANELSYGKTKAWCDDCYKKLIEFNEWADRHDSEKVAEHNRSLIKRIK